MASPRPMGHDVVLKTAEKKIDMIKDGQSARLFHIPRTSKPRLETFSPLYDVSGPKCLIQPYRYFSSSARNLVYFLYSDLRRQIDEQHITHVGEFSVAVIRRENGSFLIIRVRMVLMEFFRHARQNDTAVRAFHNNIVSP